MDWCGGFTNASLPEQRAQGHLLIGPPGSGKSTLASILSPLLPARVIANDALREQLWGDANVQGPWSELEPHLHGAIDRAIADGDNVLVDATHAQLNWRRGLMQRSKGGQHLSWTGWWLQTPLEQCLVWNRSRQRSVPEAVIRAMHVRLNSPPHRPELSEGFTSLIHLNPAGPQLNNQINRALQTILDPSP